MKGICITFRGANKNLNNPYFSSHFKYSYSFIKLPLYSEEISLSVFSLPKYYEFRDSLPKTLYNKVDYKKLEKEEEEKRNSKN